MSKYTDLSKEELLKEVEKLQQELKAKKYGLVWDSEKEPEKVVLDCENNLPILERVKDKEIKTDNSDDNILIEGDNYHALTVLNYTHKGKIDVIYIDPPYNTGKKDFRYNDNWILEDDGYRHSKWLNFMEKRLKLALNLLKRSGVIFISIDDNEYAQLKLLCDKIFGEENRLSTHHIQVRYGNKSLNEKKDFQELLEYVLVYTKDKQKFKANRPKEDYDISKFNLQIEELKAPDKILEINGRKVEIFLSGSYSVKKVDVGNADLFKETWLSGSIYSGTGHGKMYQKIVEKRVEIDGLSTLYKIDGLGEDGLGFRYMINPQKENSTRGKMFTKMPLVKKENLQNGIIDVSKPIINYYDFSGDFGNIRHEGGVGFNSGKKPIKMLKQLINYHTKKSITVLDFFAGSGSTGHAVLDLNEEDGGNRRFILCTNNEERICEDITFPRLKNCIKGVSSKKLGGNLQYFKTGLIDVERVDMVSDSQKQQLTYKAGQVIAIKENTFEEVETNPWYQIFESKDKKRKTAIYFRESLDQFDSLIEKIGKTKTVLYLYSYGRIKKETFQNIGKNIVIEDIPEPILEIYKEINLTLEK